jgi:hypothetical protein
VISSNFNGTRIRRENLNPSGGQENAFPLLTTQTEYTPWIINYKGKEKNYVASGSEEMFLAVRARRIPFFSSFPDSFSEIPFFTFPVST